MARAVKPSKRASRKSARARRQGPAGSADSARQLAASRAQQKAANEILRVMAASPGDVQPVFDAIVRSAARLCRASFARIFLVDGEMLQPRAQFALRGRRRPAEARSIPLRPMSLSGRAILERRTVHVADIVPLLDREYPDARENAIQSGFRAVLAVPLLHGNEACGTIVLWRRVARKFIAEHVALVETFARQAAIAIESAKQSHQTREALEQQTATAEILRAISASPGDLQPVLDTVVQAAARFCDASDVAIMRVEGDVLRAEAGVGPFSDGIRARRGSMHALTMPITRETVSGRSVVERRIVHVHDLAQVAEGEYPIGREFQREFGHRTTAVAPLLRDGAPIGAIGLFRSHVQPFSDHQIELLRAFASQAVIAIENVRLFNETKEALERQTATAEVLSAISGAQTDASAVFETIARNAHRLSGAVRCNVLRYDGSLLHVAACRGFSPEGEEELRRRYPVAPSDDSLMSERVVRSGRVEEIDDARHDPLYDQVHAAALDLRRMLGVPMVRDGVVLGAIVLGWREPGRTPAPLMELLRTFADQAVIAIENVRLFNETKEALERQTATSDVLRVIAGSTTDAQPVFDVVAQRACKLCKADAAVVSTVGEESIDLAAIYGMTPDAVAKLRTRYPLATDAGSLTARVIESGAVEHVADVLADKSYGFRDIALMAHWRSALCVPIVRDGAVIGTIFVARPAPGLFADTEVALLRTFADQAVIAIENARLFTELQTRNQELTDALDQQTATSDILRVISQSTTSIEPVFESIVASSLTLCDAAFSGVYLLEGDVFSLAATAGLSEDDDARFRSGYPRRIGADTVSGLAALECRVVQTPDLIHDPQFSAAPGSRVNARTVLGVPMVREGKAIGSIGVWRSEVKLFSDTQIALLQTFADQAVIAIENVRLFSELQKRNAALTEALDQQTATSEILGVISRSPTDVQPVFDTIAEAARRLCGAGAGIVFTFDGELLDVAAVAHVDGDAAQEIRGHYPRPAGRNNASTRAIAQRAVVAISDVLDDPEYDTKATAVGGGFRSMLSVPLLRDAEPIGAITIGRAEPGEFSNVQIALLQTFADQAVIAIENVRLFTELQERNAALREALEQQTATSEILRVISRSPTDVQPVFDTIAAAVLKLCRATSANLLTFDGEQLHIAALANVDPQAELAFREFYPRRINRDTAVTRAVMTRDVVEIPDILEDPDYAMRDAALAGGFRSVLGIPLLRDGNPIGAIAVGRPEPEPFTTAQVDLVKTFADQAVIAIENARLFRELQVSNRDLSEALEQQTATSEILRAISASPRDVQPIFDAIAGAALRLCAATTAMVTRYDGQLVHLVAIANVDVGGLAALREVFPRPLSRDTTSTRAILSGEVVAIPDVLDDANYAVGIPALRAGYRSTLAVPLLQAGRPIGCITVGRSEPGKFADSQIALLQTFADQAIIAIENVRLFTELDERTRELMRSVSELEALSEVGQAVSSTLDLETVLQSIVARAAPLAGGDGGSIWEYDEAREEFHLHATDRLPDDLVDRLRAHPIRKGEGALGRLAMTSEAVQIFDVADDRSYKSKVREAIIRAGLRSILAVPLLRENHLLGALAINRSHTGGFEPKVIRLLETFATQSALAIQNARLFRELEDKGRQLELASRHKSEFLANMSHELRTPLNAIIGFSEVLSERLFGELNDKQVEYVADIIESGRHLLALINDILDLSKIEAGRMELERGEFQLPGAIDNALTLVREKADRHGIRIERSVDTRLGPIHADERKVKQVLLNLLSNALKFTPDGGRVNVQAAVRDGMAEISVTDTGVGIAPEDQDAVFEEFRQVGASAKRREGTGLGLPISRKFIELHGGKLWLQSTPGAGSTFTFTLPLNAPGTVH
jgi:GAF domain-containing protein